MNLARRAFLVEVMGEERVKELEEEIEGLYDEATTKGIAFKSGDGGALEMMERTIIGVAAGRKTEHGDMIGVLTSQLDDIRRLVGKLPEGVEGAIVKRLAPLLARALVVLGTAKPRSGPPAVGHVDLGIGTHVHVSDTTNTVKAKDTTRRSAQRTKAPVSTPTQRSASAYINDVLNGERMLAS